MKIDNANKIINVRIISENSNGILDISKPAILRKYILKAVNSKTINFIGVKWILFDDRTKKIKIVGGYTPESGLFTKYY